MTRPIWQYDTTTQRVIDNELDPRLIKILGIYLSRQYPHISIPKYGGARTLDIQKMLVGERRTSKTLHSLHRIDNPIHPRDKSEAVDFAPIPIDWEDAKRFYICAGLIMAIADELETPVKWGGDWDGDWDYKDQQLHDLGHIELL